MNIKDGQDHQIDHHRNRRYHINSDNVCNTKMEKEERNRKERERYNVKIKDESFKEKKRKRDLEYYHKTKKIRVAKQIEKRKELLTEAKLSLGGKCVWCGSTENLEFDHIDDSKKEHNVGNAVRNTREVFWNEVGKCQLLCVSCHNKRTTAQKRAKQNLWLSLPLEERERLLLVELKDT